MERDARLTVRLSAETGDALGRLADRTHRARGTIAAEAIANYVGRELEVIEGIERGLDDVRHGRVTPHDAVVEAARLAIEAVRLEA